ncbi:MAG: UDP-2,3-diacylglucosamine diphosphatase LpxI [Spirochaetes bacterium]|nr:UDP-2,3-diacylglucosamine diphosphatase LpxI [Spirochaetota bacterium]
MNNENLALIAGDGSLPVILAERLACKNFLALVVVIQGSKDRFNSISVPVYEIPLGRVNKSIALLSKYKINKIIIIGKIDKRGFIERKGFDLKALKVIKTVKDGMDMSIFDAVSGEFKKIGIDILPQDEYLKDMISTRGVLTKRKPSSSEMSEAVFGMEHAKKLATMDIGQTVIVKNHTLIAVEAAEGTNETIRRGASLSGKKFIICKAARAKQDRRFDIPGIGMDTLNLMNETGCNIIAIEAGKVLIADMEKVLKFADKNKISIIGI